MADASVGIGRRAKGSSERRALCGVSTNNFLDSKSRFIDILPSSIIIHYHCFKHPPPRRSSSSFI